VALCLPAERRRTVDFRRDVMPIVSGKCASCHRAGGPPPRLDGGLAPAGGSAAKAPFNRAYEALLTGEPAEARGPWRGRFVQPGQARTSPLVWRLFARNTSRPWDAAAGEKRDWPGRCGAHRLTDDEKRTFVEWIDLGALWDGIPALDVAPVAETFDPSEGIPE